MSAITTPGNSVGRLGTFNPELVVVPFSIDTVIATGNSGILVLPCSNPFGKLVHVDVSLATTVDSQITFELYSNSAGTEVSKVLQIVQIIQPGYHTQTDVYFSNTDSPRVSNLYVKVTHTGGSDDTGVISGNLYLTS